MNQKITQCVACGGKHLIEDTRDISHTYRGQTFVIPQHHAVYCLDCPESYFLSKESAEQYARALRTQKEHIDAEQSEKIHNVRRRLKLKQSEAAQLFGGGSMAFSRYETGKVTPPLALVQLFKLLDKHPELLNELR